MEWLRKILSSRSRLHRSTPPTLTVLADSPGCGGDVLAAGKVASNVAVHFPQALARTFKADGDKQPVGSEGMHVIVAAGCAPESQCLLEKRVEVAMGASYALYTTTSFNTPMFAVLPDDVQACSWTD